MLRYRRYRAFVVFVVFALAGTYYYFTSTSTWQPSALVTRPWTPHSTIPKSEGDAGRGAASGAQAGQPPDLEAERRADTANIKSSSEDGDQKLQTNDRTPVVKPKLRPDDEKTVIKPKPQLDKFNALPKQKPELNDEEAAVKPKKQGSPASEDVQAVAATGKAKQVGKAEPTNEDKQTTPKHAVGELDDEEAMPRNGKSTQSVQQMDMVKAVEGIDALTMPSASPTPIIHWERRKERYPVSSTVQLPTALPSRIPRIQHDFAKESASAREARLEKLAEIAASARRMWNGYKATAWLHDETRPVTGGFKDPFCGWAATLVDSLDTLYIMGMHDDFEAGVEAIRDMDFTTSPRVDIPLFETTIRYLGGLLGAYDISGAKHEILLTKAVELAEVLIGAFDTPNRMPVTFFHWQPAMRKYPLRASVMTVFAELGSLSVEFTRLAQLTHEPKYYDAVDRITDALLEWQTRPVNGTRLPGMFPTMIDASGCEPQIVTRPDRDSIGIDDSLITPTMEAADAAEASSAHEAGLAQSVRGRKSVDRLAMKATNSDTAVKSRVKGTTGPVMAATHDLTADGDRDPSRGSEKSTSSKVGTKKTSVDVGASSNKKLKNEMTERARSPTDRDASEEIRESSVRIKRQSGGTLSAEAAKELEDEISTTGATSVGKSSQLLGSSTESEHVDRAESVPAIDRDHSRNKAPLSGSMPLEGSTGRPKDICKPKGLTSPNTYASDDFTLSGMADSVYEYFPKQWLLLGGVEKKYQELYERSIDVATEKLLFRPQLPKNENILIAGDWHVKPIDKEIRGRLSPSTGHLACFAGGMYAMAAKIFERPDDLNTAARLTDGCVWAYASTTTGIMPETVTFLPCESKEHCEFNKTAYWDALDPYWEDRLGMYETMVKEQKQKAAEHIQSDAGNGVSTDTTVENTKVKDKYTTGRAVGAQEATLGKSEEDKKSAQHSLGKSDAKNPQLITDDAADINQKNPQKIADDTETKVDQKNPQRIADDDDDDDDTAERQKNKQKITDDDESGQIRQEKTHEGMNDDSHRKWLRRRQIDDLGGASPVRTTTSSESDTDPGSTSEDSSDEDGPSSQLEHGVDDIKAGKPLDYANAPSKADEDVGPGAGSPIRYGGDAEDPSASSDDRLSPAVEALPEPPPTHEEAVLSRIKHDRLPPGVVDIPQRNYILRPEAIESVWYMYRITGEQRWRDAGWKMWKAVSKHTATKFGNSAIDDVTKQEPALLDSQESFWMAETLKYFYLLFSDEDLVSLDDYVLNTEAHPFKRPVNPTAKDV